MHLDSSGIAKCISEAIFCSRFFNSVYANIRMITVEQYASAIKVINAYKREGEKI